MQRREAQRRQRHAGNGSRMPHQQGQQQAAEQRFFRDGRDDYREEDEPHLFPRRIGVQEQRDGALEGRLAAQQVQRQVPGETQEPDQGQDGQPAQRGLGQHRPRRRPRAQRLRLAAHPPEQGRQQRDLEAEHVVEEAGGGKLPEELREGQYEHDRPQVARPPRAGRRELRQHEPPWGGAAPARREMETGGEPRRQQKAEAGDECRQPARVGCRGHQAPDESQVSRIA